MTRVRKRRLVVAGGVMLFWFATGGRSAGQSSNPQPPAEMNAEPFAFADFTWLTGNPRTKESPLDTKAFTGEFRADVNFTYSFNRPSDDTIVGSSEVFRSGEFQVTQLGVGGDLHYDNVQGRLMTQFGMYSQTTPRNDASPARGQWDLADAYRYISEAYGGYHFDHLNGINVQAGIFMSYVGLWSYYQFDNWTYQPSYVSSNTPWFFNGMRVQIFPSDKLKIEPWLINGWQSYGRFNHAPGVGGQILWRPNGSLSIVFNNYWGADTLGNRDRKRIHLHGRRGLRIRRWRQLRWQVGRHAFADLPRLHGLPSPLVRQGPAGADRRGRRHQQPRAVPGAVAANQRRDRGVRHALLHREPRGSIQGMGHVGHLRLHAESVRDVPFRVQSPRRKRAVLLGRRRCDAAGWQRVASGLVRAGLGARPAQVGEPDYHRAAGEILTGVPQARAGNRAGGHAGQLREI
jgi:hypothetical protein